MMSDDWRDYIEDQNRYTEDEEPDAEYQAFIAHHRALRARFSKAQKPSFLLFTLEKEEEVKA